MNLGGKDPSFISFTRISFARSNNLAAPTFNMAASIGAR
jgi:hypothetical protein